MILLDISDERHLLVEITNRALEPPNLRSSGVLGELDEIFLIHGSRHALHATSVCDGRNLSLLAAAANGSATFLRTGFDI
jgi:hypothetical protein